MYRLIWIALLFSACVPKSKPELSEKLNCELPPERAGEFVRTECAEVPDQALVYCTYVGYRESKLCVSIVASRACGEYTVAWSQCDGVKIMVMLPDVEPTSTEAPAPVDETL